MKRLGPVPALVLLMLLAACQAGTGASASATGGVSEPSVVATPGGSAGIVLRQAPADLGCDSIGWEGEPYKTLTFHVDPAAADHVWAESDTGATLTTQWSEGFQGGTAEERVVRDPQGGVFITDGEAVAVPEGANLMVKGYFICLRPDTLYVLPAGNG